MNSYSDVHTLRNKMYKRSKVPLTKWTKNVMCKQGLNSLHWIKDNTFTVVFKMFNFTLTFSFT